MPQTLEDRFLAKFDIPADENDCWLWTATITNVGYGRLWRDGRHVLAHRLAYELYFDIIPDGFEVDHRCHNESDCAGGVQCQHRRCVNPRHLMLASTRDNLLRGKGLSAQNAVKTHCLRGHEFTPENTAIYFGPTGRPMRFCKECDRYRHHR
jgi:HNH endonuclease